MRVQCFRMHAGGPGAQRGLPMRHRIHHRQSGGITLRSSLHALVAALLIFWPGMVARVLAAEAGDVSDAPARYIVGISPFLDKSVKDDVFRRLAGFILEDVPLGASVWLYDGYHLRTIAQLEVPDVRAFRSGKTRANQFKEQILKLKQFLAADHPRPEESKLPFNDAVRFPQFMDFIADNLHDTNRAMTVLLLGSPLYVDHKEPGFSMMDGYFPSDGHLLASREGSPFGIKGRSAALEGIRVHFAYFGDPWVSEIHQEKISRFWSLYLQGQGARLITFCGDLLTAFNAARSKTVIGDARPERHRIDDTHSKIEMLRVTRDVGVADWITRDLSPDRALPPPSRTIGPMKIGIRWKGDVDLDLYAGPAPDRDMLYFEHTRIPEGYYFKDHRSSPDREYEFIEFESPVDVWQVRAMVNFFAGRAAEGMSGEVRVEFDGRIYSGQFHIPARQGNEGRSGPSQDKWWVAIDVPALLKLREGRLQAGN